MLQKMVPWAGWPRVWRSAAIFVAVAGMNVVALFGILRLGVLLNPVPGESTTAFFPRSGLDGILHQPSSRVESNDRHASLSFNSESTDKGREHHDGIDPKHAYFVCVPILVGDDSNGPSDSALPFAFLYRLFDSAKEEISKKLLVDGEKSKRRSSASANADQSSPVKLLVVVDFPSLVCKMARDSLQDAGSEFQRVELTCLTLKELAATRAPPLKSLSCNTVVVGKSTRFLPQLALEWAQFIKWNNLKIVDLDALDPHRAPPTVPRELWKPTVITAFSSNHLAVGLLLLRSLGRAGMELAKAGEYNISIVAYTLEDFDPTLQGIVDCVIRELNENYSVPTELRKFDFSAHPGWMRVNQSIGYEGAGKWAWKAVMMHELLVERGFVLWTDAGCRYTAPALSETLNFTRDYGFASKFSAGVVPQYVHPGQIKYFRYKVKYRREERVHNCDTSGIGLTLDTYDAIARPFYDCSMTRQCIGPDGATRDNHRFEQAAMTLISDMNGTSCRGLSNKVRRHMDYHQQDYSGTYPTHCYRDPLPVPPAGG